MRLGKGAKNDSVSSRQNNKIVPEDAFKCCFIVKEAGPQNNLVLCEVQNHLVRNLSRKVNVNSVK